MTQKDLTILTKYINCILDNSLDISVNTHLHDIIDFCRINLVNELNEEELDELAESDCPYYDHCYVCADASLDEAFKEGYKAGYRKAKEL